MPLDHEAVAVPVGLRATAPESDPNRAPAPEPSPAPIESAMLTPPIDLYEGPDGLVLEADLPGVPDDLVTIQLEENVLHLRGKVVEPVLVGTRVLHQEYRPDDFWRSFILSDEVDRSRITASLKNGVLRITLARADRIRTRRIEIKTS